MTPPARVQAAIELLDLIILSACEAGAAADTVIARYFKNRRYAGSKDRRAVRELVYGAIRLCGERPTNGRAAILALARQQCELAPLFDGSPHGPAPIEKGERPARTGLMPQWLIPHLVSLVQNESEQRTLLDRAPLDLRINRLNRESGQVYAAFPEAQLFDFLSDALRLPEGSPVERSQVWRDGLIEIQDVGSQLIAGACEARPGMTVVDLCAGAGGKTLALASAMAGEGKLIAADVNRDRLARLPDRAQRAGATFIETVLLDSRRESAALRDYEGTADVVLVDAPCSGTGTWRRNPEARWRLSPERLARLTTEQARILDFAAPLVKSGGKLVHAVCSLTEAEGNGQVEAFLARNGGWEINRPALPLGRSHGCGRLLTPAHDGTDGFFIAALQRS